jgi:hypothetical protein
MLQYLFSFIGIGTKFFNSMVDFFSLDGKYPYVTLESETRMIPYYLKLKCTDMHVQSDSFGDDKYFLLYFHLSPSSTSDAVPSPTPTTTSPLDGLEKVVVDLKTVLHDAAVFVAVC